MDSCKTKYNLVSWNTWKKRNNPKISYNPDGERNVIYSINPTLQNYGFQFIDNEYSHIFKETAKKVATRLLDDWVEICVGDPDISNWEFVYYKHYGYITNNYPDGVYVYGRYNA